MALTHVDFFSDTLGMCVEMDVIMPENTVGQIGMEGVEGEGKWKTLYLLHGMSDDHTIWQRRTSIERYAADKGICVVMPSTQLGWYTDMYIGQKWFTYISEELPRICRSFFPSMSNRREDTFVCGLSMGGYGAIKLALRAPETFSWGASLSGALDIADLCENALLRREAYWYDVFGPKDEVRGSYNDLFAAAEELKANGKPMPKLYMWCGTEDSLYPHTVRMREHLEKLGYDLTYHESPGIHSWEYWDTWVQSVLEWLPLSKEGK